MEGRLESLIARVGEKVNMFKYRDSLVLIKGNMSLWINMQK